MRFLSLSTLSFFWVVLFYGMSFLASSATLVFSNGSPFSLPSLLQAEDALFVLEQQKKTSQKFEINQANQILYLHKDHPILLYTLSVMALENGNNAVAYEYLARANEADPYNIEYRDQLLTYLFKHQMFDPIQKDIKMRGFEGLNEKWTPQLYNLGLMLIDNGQRAQATSLWEVAAMISPSWSHMWIEYASLLYFEGRERDARNVLKTCGNDEFAGAHCRVTIELWNNGAIDQPGTYSYVINPKKTE